MRVVGHLLGEVDHTRGNAGFEELFDPVSSAVVEENLLDVRPPRFNSVAIRLVCGVEIRVICPVRHPDDRADRVAVALGHGAEHEGALVRVVAAVVEPMRSEAWPLRLPECGNLVVFRARGPQRLELGEKRVSDHRVVDGFAHHGWRLQFQRRVDQGNVDLLALAGIGAVEERGADAHRRRQP